jgi:serine/threonine protein kinase/Tfp pilus assembly protein PilF
MIGQNISHYKVLEKLGEGGMGVVYKAMDTRLDRLVALKFLPHRLIANETQKTRFLQEAKAAGQLNHPNICTIYGIEEHLDEQFIIMELVDGKTLRTHIAHSASQIPFNQIVDWALQIGSALAVAHDKDITHRDIKPDNIMVNSGNQIKVMDFGLAKFKGEIGLTRTSTAMGTIGYMSPEQIRAETVDHRTDIWSFGVVLYELLSGRLPFRGEHQAAMVYSITNEECQPIISFRADTPQYLQAIVARALEKEQQRRYQSFQEVLSDLRQSAPPRTVEVPPATTLKNPPSIGVLPFTNISADPENEYFCDGLSEELTTALTRLEQLFVVARTSAFSFKGKGMDVREIGRKLNVDHILEGSVKKIGNRLRITVQLVNVQNGYQVWTERFDRTVADIFAIQDEITLATVERLKVKLLGKDKIVILRRYQDNVDAYDLYLKGRYHWAQRPQGIKKAIEYFEQAVEKDPNYALAHAGLADCYVTLGSWENGTLSPAEAMPKGKSAARKALELDNTLAEAQSSLAYGTTHFDWDWPDAETRFKRAFDLNPNYAIGRHWYSHYLTARGRTEESLVESKRCLELDPLDLVINVHLAWHYQFARQYDEAIEQCWKTSELYPNSFWPAYFFALAYEQQGKFKEAAAEFEKAVKLSGNVTFAAAGLGHLYAVSGKKAEARKVIIDLQELSKIRYVPAYDIAVIHASLSQQDEAFEWLERAYQERSGWLAYLNVEPRLDGLRSDSRFTDLLRRVRLTP